MNAARERDGSGGDDIDLVAKVALDSAEVANRSARAAAHTASKLAEVTAHFDRSLARQRRQMVLIVSVCGVVALLAFAMFIASAIQLRGRVAQINTVLAVVASRAVDLRQGLDQIAPLAERVEGFATQVAAMNRIQRELQSGMQNLDRSLAARPLASAPPPSAPVPPATKPVAPPAPVVQKPQPPAESAEQIAAREKLLRQTLDAVQAIATQARSLEANLRSQSTALSGLASRVATIEQSVSTLPAMQGDLKVLLRNDQTRAAVVEKVVSERRREETLRADRERFVQFPAQSAEPGVPGSVPSLKPIPAPPR